MFRKDKLIKSRGLKYGREGNDKIYNPYWIPLNAPLSSWPLLVVVVVVAVDVVLVLVVVIVVVVVVVLFVGPTK